MKAPASFAKNFLLFKFAPSSTAFGLLVLRLLVGASLFLKHGWLPNFTRIGAHYPDPLHIGHVPSLVGAVGSAAVCSVLVALGLATRWAALICVINISLAWSLVHHFMFFGNGADHGELCILYISVYLAIFFAGAGRYSIDAAIGA